MKNIFFVLFLMVSLSSIIISQSRDNIPTLAGKVAGNYGIDSWSKVTSIEFTFNVNTGQKTVKRKWTWQPALNIIKFTGADQNGKDTIISYNRKKMDHNNPTLTYVDKRFINDSYWLLFPFHLVWDKNVEIKDQGIKELPISHKKGRSLIIRYTNNVGYTPNDVFILFLDNNNMINEWIYRPGGNKEKQRIYTWEDNRKFGGITIATKHNGPDNTRKVWFTGIDIQTKKGTQ